jgi:eukaryotic-like serine/threonine-protein kinase
MERETNLELGDAGPDEPAPPADAQRPAEVATLPPPDDVDAVELAAEPDAAEPDAESGTPDWQRALVRSRVFPRLDKAPRIGRYRVLRKLGRGGMGTVVAAHDETLDRRVALKLLHDDLAAKPRQRHRLMREAQAMARVSHPNVVTVYEADVFQDQLYIAMELVEGHTLDAWQRQLLRGWRACFDAYVQAGRGLEAAHDQMLVHRDFKPGNCIIDAQGRVRVLDFGLARDTTHGPVPSELTAVSDSSVLSTNITVTGAMIGTIAYMSPEQLQGKPADARSDQFSFCVSMYEALYGQRPFTAETAGELLAAIMQQRFGVLPKSSRRRVPGWLRRILRKGLALHPAERHTSMTELLARLEAVPRRRRRLTLGSLGTGLLALVGVASAELASPTTVSPCAELRGQPPAGWDERTRDAVEHAILGTELSDAPVIWGGVSGLLDAYADEWSAARVVVCEAGSHGPRALTAAHAAQLSCLDDRARVLTALSGRLVEADGRMAAHAVSAADALPSVAECLEGFAAPERPVAPEALRPQIDDVLERTARVFVLERLGRFEGGLELAQSTLMAARALAEHYEPPLAGALLAQGRLLRRSRRFAPAEAALTEAMRVAERNHDDRGNQDVLHELVLLTLEQQRVPEGRVWLQQAQAKAERVGERRDHDLLLRHDEARMALAAGDLEHAAQRLDEAIDGYRELPHAGSRLGEALITLALVREQQSRYDEALVLYQEALAGFQRNGDLQGAGEVTYDLGSFYLGLDQLAAAEDAFERALALFAAAHGEESPLVGNARFGMATALYRQRQLDRALAEAVTAERLLRDGGSIDDRVWAHALVATIHQQANRPEDALHGFLLAEALVEAGGVDAETRATVLAGVGDSLMNLGRLTEAEPRHQKALELLEASGDERHPALVFALFSIGRLRSAQGRLPEARAAFERAWRLQQQHEDRSTTAMATWFLAEVSWRLGDTARARELTAIARKIYEELGITDELQTIDNFLQACGSKCQ